MIEFFDNKRHAMNIFYYHIHIKDVPLPFNSADTIPCKLGSSPNQNTHNSFALLILSGSLLDWQPVEGLLRHAHKMSWLRADENDFSTGSSTGLAPHWLKTYFRHFKPHKSVCQKKKGIFIWKMQVVFEKLNSGHLSSNVEDSIPHLKNHQKPMVYRSLLKKISKHFSGKSLEFTWMYIS